MAVALRILVLLQAIRDAREAGLPPHIQSLLNQIEFYIEINHEGKKHGKEN